MNHLKKKEYAQSYLRKTYFVRWESKLKDMSAECVPSGLGSSSYYVTSGIGAAYLRCGRAPPYQVLEGDHNPGVDSQQLEFPLWFYLYIQYVLFFYQILDGSSLVDHPLPSPVNPPPPDQPTKLDGFSFSSNMFTNTSGRMSGSRLQDDLFLVPTRLGPCAGPDIRGGGAVQTGNLTGIYQGTPRIRDPLGHPIIRSRHQL